LELIKVSRQSETGIPAKVTKKFEKSAIDFASSGVFKSEFESELRQGELS
jgi:hypothetical protein